MFRIVKNKNARFSRYMNLFSKGGASSPPGGAGAFSSAFSSAFDI